MPAPARWGSLTCVAGGTVNGVVKSGEHAGANITLPSALGQLSGLTRLSLRDHNHTLSGDGVKDDVAWLEVTMDHAAIVRLGETAED